ncbi:MAG: BON domain-containing protein [Acidobacteria bacterium]|nr:BON domain-containing protein [Acidobacteriota bacterium]
MQQRFDPRDYRMGPSGRYFGREYPPAQWRGEGLEGEPRYETQGRFDEREFNGPTYGRWERYNQFSGFRTENFAGCGPKNFKRADDRILDDAYVTLTCNPNLDASDVEIAVKDGLVTLGGKVETRNCKRLAEDIVEDIPGVRDVRNEIRVQGWNEPERTAGSQEKAGAGKIHH